MVGDNPKWVGVEELGANTFLYKTDYPDKIDVGFVDGHGASRYACVNFLMARNVPVILAHDTNSRSYRWDLVNSEGYTSVTHKELSPWTTVWTKDS